jgi:hypothetical protein
MVHVPRPASSLVWMASPIQFVPNNREETWPPGCSAGSAGVTQPVHLGGSSTRRIDTPSARCGKRCSS